MSWYRAFGTTEIILIALFAVFYGLYLYRVVQIARTLNTSFSNIFIKLVLRIILFALLIIA
ncbi:MAG: aerotolerance regulator BatB, partial [Cyclobacteriaceae bacterium]|nr:aerotolerance regulator BatB [Cyclobacteriaceae bacterium]